LALLLVVAAMGILAASGRWLPQPKVRVHLALTALILALLMLVASCGGGGGSSTPPNPGTPIGNYNLMVTATFTSGSTTLTHSEAFTLSVQ